MGIDDLVASPGQDPGIIQTNRFLTDPCSCSQPPAGAVDRRGFGQQALAVAGEGAEDGRVVVGFEIGAGAIRYAFGQVGYGFHCLEKLVQFELDAFGDGVMSALLGIERTHIIGA